MLDTLFALRRLGHEVRPVMEGEGMAAARFTEHGFPLLAVPPFATHPAQAAAVVAREVAAAEPHILCATGRHDAAVVNRALKGARTTPMTVLYRLSAFPLEEKGDAREFADGAHLTIATSIEQRERLFPHKEEDRDLVIVTSGVRREFVERLTALESSTARRELGIPEGSFVFTVSSRLSWEKGIDRVIRAMKPVSESCPSALLLLTGDGAEREALSTLVRESGLTERVLFTGHLPDVAPALVATDVAVLATVVPEPQPLALKEAMAIGRPVIASRTGGIPEFVTDEENGLLVSDDDELTRAMLRLAAEPALAAELGRRARRTVLGGHLFEQKARHLSHCLDRHAIRHLPLDTVLGELAFAEMSWPDDPDRGVDSGPRIPALTGLPRDVLAVLRDAVRHRDPRRLLGLPAGAAPYVETFHALGVLVRPAALG
ncbi:glycosyltransferase family 4 protein [Streptomyces sp. NPDC091377]|uniref:glycosyltransferase family 4 protein n=1 Tax=Streptomyces sp. NPDC091377 TaxID=3365995 RepID=UPI00381800FE